MGSFGGQKLKHRGQIWQQGKKKGKGICFKHFVAWNVSIKTHKKLEQRILLSLSYILSDDKYTQNDKSIIYVLSYLLIGEKGQFF